MLHAPTTQQQPDTTHLPVGGAVSAPASQLLQHLAPWQLAAPDDDGNQLDRSIYAAQDRAATERALADALKLNGELVADRDALRARVAELQDKLVDANELIATLTRTRPARGASVDIIEGEVQEQVAS